MDYRAKYLKYKAKYLDLKDKLEGGKVTDIKDSKCNDNNYDDRRSSSACWKSNGCYWDPTLDYGKGLCQKITCDYYNRNELKPEEKEKKCVENSKYCSWDKEQKICY